MPFDQAPLTTLDAKRSLKPTLASAPLCGTAPAHEAECARSLASKRQMRLSKIGPLARHWADEETTPHRCGAKNTCPEAQRSGLQPHGPQPPDAVAGSPESVTDRPVRKEQPLRCGMPDLAPDGASFKAPLKLPRGDRLAADTGAGASRPWLQDPVNRASSRKNRLAADT
jgi:hypothetical protein